MPPSYEDVCSAFARIREKDPNWDLNHPERDFALAAGLMAILRGDLARLAAYRLAGEPPPLGYYDGVRDKLHHALELVERQRRNDHGDAPYASRHATPDPAWVRK